MPKKTPHPRLRNSLNIHETQSKGPLVPDLNPPIIVLISRMEIPKIKYYHHAKCSNAKPSRELPGATFRQTTKTLPAPRTQTRTQPSANINFI